MSGALLGACATVPETGRSQILLVSPAQESQLGFQEFEKLKKTVPISRDAAANAQLQRVGQRIAAVASLPNARWEFVLFDKPDTPNAFCLPGGKVGVFSGILPITKDDAGLATVIGHEVAHAVARHGAERMSEAMLIQLGGQILEQATIGRSEAAGIRLEGDQFASHMHARIMRRGAYHFVEDLGSTNGTFLNDRRIERDAQLKVRDELRIGQTILRYEE